MRQSNLYLAFIALLAAVLLTAFGLAVLPSVFPSQQPAGPIDAMGTPLVAPHVDVANPQKGATNPKVTIVEFGDYQCEACATMDADLARLLAAFPNDVRIAWKDLPNTGVHPQALASAVAARCADQQGAFWKFHDILMANQGSTGDDNRLILAGQLGLDTSALQSCMTQSATLPLVQRDAEEAVRLRVDATPYLFIGSRRVSGAVGYDQLEAFVRASMTAAAATADTVQKP